MDSVKLENEPRSKAKEVKIRQATKGLVVESIKTKRGKIRSK